MSKYQIETGIRVKALRVVIYGVAGIGKTTLAAQFPNPVFIDVEDGSNQLPVARMPRPTSWAMLMDEVREVATGNVPCSTLVIDTADAAEELCIRSLCAEHSWDGLESPGYGKGYTYLAEAFGKLLDECGRVVDSGRNIVFVSHSIQRKVERPDEEGAYDRYELKLSKKVAPMLKEWSDTLLFCDYKTIVETESNKKGQVTKAKAKGGRRIIRTCFHVCWDAKNRFGLPAEVPLDYASIAHCIPDMLNGGLDANLQPAQPMQPPAPTTQHSVPQMPLPKPPTPPAPPAQAPMQSVDDRLASMEADVARLNQQPQQPQSQQKTPTLAPNDPRASYPDYASPLVELMVANDVTDAELRAFVVQFAGAPTEMPVTAYPQDLINALVAQFGSVVLPAVQAQRKA